jgi:hypothetical protein
MDNRTESEENIHATTPFNKNTEQKSINAQNMFINRYFLEHCDSLNPYLKYVMENTTTKSTILTSNMANPTPLSPKR